MSTNDVRELAAGKGRIERADHDKGRIVDAVLHLDLGDRGVLLVTSRRPRSGVTAWLDRYLFTEKVELVDASTSAAPRS